jgi:hypothetical protein
MGGELVHVRPYLGDQDLRCPAVYPWDGVKELYLLRERGDLTRSISMLNSAMDSSR